MANAKDPSPTLASKSSVDDAAKTAQVAADAGARQIDESARAAKAVAEKTAEASRAVAQANSEILGLQLQTVQQAVHSSLEVGKRGFEGLTKNWALDVATPNPELAERSAQNVQAVSQASGELAKGALDASRAWFDLAQKRMRTNLEALGQLASCRSLQDVSTLQSNLLRDNLQQALECGDLITRAHLDAIQGATRAMKPRSQPAR